MEMTINQLVDRLNQQRGTVVGLRFVAETSCRLNKKIDGQPNPVSGATKVASVEAVLNPIHQNSVRRQQTREGMTANYESGPCQWGERLWREDGSVAPIRYHQGQPHSMVVQHKSTHQVRFRIDGRWATETETAEIERQLSEKNAKARASAQEKQGVERPIRHLTYRFDNIVQIELDGLTFDIV